MTAITLLVGSVYGGAELVAETATEELTRLGHTVNSPRPPDVDDLLDDKMDMLLICTSTTGAGDLPDELVPLHQTIVDTPPRIVGLPYTLVILGDSSYDTFCGGGKALDAALTDIGAARICEPLLIDAMEVDEPEVEALPWIVEVVANFKPAEVE